MWPCCNVSPLNTGPLCCMVLACSKALCLYCCWLFMATSENDGNEWWAIILKWRIILQANLSADKQHNNFLHLSTRVIPVSLPGNTKFNSEILQVLVFWMHYFYPYVLQDSFYLQHISLQLPSPRCSYSFLVLFISVFTSFLFLLWPFTFFHTPLNPSSQAVSHFLPSFACQS